jgi:hypothetical protein
MSNQLVITSGAKVRSLEGVLTGTSGVVNSVPLGGANGVATLDSMGKVPLSQLPASVVTYLGTWNASTNTPTLANGTGDIGDLYICNVAGTVNFGAGPITFSVGDWVIYNGSTWQRSAGQAGTVTSVGLTSTAGAFTITNSPVTTSGNIGLNFSGNSGQYVGGDGSLITFPSIITQAQNLVTEVYNETGATLTKGTIVYINGGHGNLPTITKALATSDATSAQTYGVVRADITNMNNGYVTVIGNLDNIDTSAYTAGTQLYLSGTTAGTWTSTKPYAPIHLVYVGIVVRSHPTQGVIEVKIQNGYELDELHNVSAQTPSNNQGLFYNSSNSLWENKSIATALGYTPANAALVVPYTGATGNVNLGSNNLTASNLFGETSLNVKILASGSSYSTGYSTFSSLAGTLTMAQSVSAGNLKAFTFDFSAWATNTSYTYTLPALNGTLALLEGTQTFSGSKTFGLNNLIADGGILFKATAVPSSYTTGYVSAWFNINGSKNSLGLASSATSPVYYYYDFPNQAGTIALTSDLTNFVTLTGTTQTISSAKTFTSFPTKFQDVYIEGIGTSASGVNLKIASGGFASAGGGYITLYSSASKKLFVYDGSSTSTAALDFSSITSAITRTYTYPDANGTLVLGTGTTNYLPKFTGTSTLGNSLIWDNGTNVGIGNTNTTYTFDVTGTGRFTGALTGTTATFTAGTFNPSFIAIGSSSGNGQIQLSGSANYKIGAGTDYGGMAFTVGGSDRIYVLNNGNVGIGTSSPSTKLHISNAGDVFSQVSNTTKGNAYFGCDSTGIAIGSDTSSVPLYFFTNSGGGATERMRITSGGNVIIGTTSTLGGSAPPLTTYGSSAGPTFVNAASAQQSLLLWNQGTTGNNLFTEFHTEGTLTLRGSIYYNRGTGLVIYATTSDYRLKSEIEEFNALEILNKLKPKKFKIGDSELKSYGFIAHELQEYLPQAVIGEKDELKEDGSEKYQQVDYSQLTGLLTKAIQEQNALIQELSAKVSALESKI